MFNVGGPEMFVLAILAFLVFGPEGLPGVIKNVMRTVRALRTAAADFQTEVKNSLEEENERQDLAARQGKRAHPHHSSPIQSGQTETEEEAEESEEDEDSQEQPEEFAEQSLAEETETETESEPEEAELSDVQEDEAPNEAPSSSDEENSEEAEQADKEEEPEEDEDGPGLPMTKKVVKSTDS